MADSLADSDKARTLRPLQAAACTYRIAFGPRATVDAFRAAAASAAPSIWGVTLARCRCRHLDGRWYASKTSSPSCNCQSRNPTMTRLSTTTGAALLAAAATMSGGHARAANIAFVSQSSTSATSGSVTVAKPAGVTFNTLLLAEVATGPATTVITAPNGWTLAQRVDNSAGTGTSLAVYYHVATATEGASYFWGLSGNGDAIVGLMGFSGVDTTNPIDTIAGASTAFSLSHAAPSITPAVDGTMVVAMYMYASSGTWTAPVGTSEVLDVASRTTPNSAGLSAGASQALQCNNTNGCFAAATGAMTATASGNADNGTAISLSLRPFGAPPPVPEPASWLLLGAGLSLLPLVRRRQLKAD